MRIFLDANILFSAAKSNGAVRRLLGLRLDTGHDYQRKRRELLRSSAHVMEIDLLRGGTRPPLTLPVPASAYRVTLSRAEARPKVEVWTLQLADPLPVLPVPLREPDPDALLDLGAVIVELYERGGYEQVIDYRCEPPSPPLSDAESEWVRNILRDHRTR